MTQIETIKVEIPLMQVTITLMQVTITLDQDYVGYWVWVMDATFVASSAEWLAQLFQEVENTTETSRFDDEYATEVLGIIVNILKAEGLGFTSVITYK